jgi:hypothetical protein
MEPFELADMLEETRSDEASNFGLPVKLIEPSLLLILVAQYVKAN